jgi:MFS family permease
MAALGAAVLVLFFVWERRAANPVIDPSLFRARAFAMGVSVVGLQNLAMYALLFELPIVLARAFGSDARTSGRVLVALTLAMVAGSMSGGRVVGRLGERQGALLGSSVAVVGMLLIAWRPLASAIDLLPGLGVLGLGIGLCTPAVQTALMGSIDRARSGMAAGVSSTGRYLGGVIGVGVVSTLLHGDDVLAAHRTAAFVLTGVLVLALAAAAALPTARQTE